MDLPPKEPLQIGKVAFAKAFCTDWLAEHSKILLATSATLIALTICLFQLSNTSLLRGKTDSTRTHSLTSSYYTRFSNNTKFITSGNYAGALKEAQQLKTDLEQDLAFWNKRDKLVKSGTVLYAYNLIRIASLERKVGSVQGELAAWDELLQNSGWNRQPKNPLTYDPDAYALVASNFQNGETSLLDFIQARKAALEASTETP